MTSADGVAVRLRVGIPRAMLYHRYAILWTSFLEGLGCEVVLSEPTNLHTVDVGSELAPSESCLPLKILLGHAKSLAGRVDCVMVPRLASVRRGEENCIKHMATYDIVANLVPDASLVCFSVDTRTRQHTGVEMRLMAERLGFGRLATSRAYWPAQVRQHLSDRRQAATAWREITTRSEKPKVLLVAHSYCEDDALIGRPITEMLTSYGAKVVSAEAIARTGHGKRAGELSRDLYWTYNRELLDAVVRARPHVDGIAFITAFPCGPDALVSDLVQRKIHDMPVINFVIDDLSGYTGLTTRIESFVDIVQATRRRR